MSSSNHPVLATAIVGIIIIAGAADALAQEGPEPTPGALDAVRKRLAEHPLEAFDETRGVYVNGRSVGLATESLAIEEDAEGRQVATHTVSIKFRTRGEGFEATGTSKFDAATLEPIEAERRVERGGLSTTRRVAREGGDVVYLQGAGKTEPSEIERIPYDANVIHIESQLYVIARVLVRGKKIPRRVRFNARTMIGARLPVDVAISPEPVEVMVRATPDEAYQIVIGRAHETADGSELLWVHENGRLLIQSTDAGASTPGGQSAITSVLVKDAEEAKEQLEPALPRTTERDLKTPENAVAFFHDALLRGDMREAESAVELRRIYDSAKKRQKDGGGHMSDHFPSFDAWRDDLLDDWLALRGRKDAVPAPDAIVKPEKLAEDRVKVFAKHKPVPRHYVVQRFDAQWKLVEIIIPK